MYYLLKKINYFLSVVVVAHLITTPVMYASCDQLRQLDVDCLDRPEQNLDDHQDDDEKAHERIMHKLQLVRDQIMRKQSYADLQGNAEDAYRLYKAAFVASAAHNNKKQIDDSLNDICTDVCIKLVESMHIRTRATVVESIEKIKEYIQYWEYVLMHPHHYFLHKSPRKWFGKETQRQEIKRHLYFLRTLEQKHYIILGDLTAHQNAFRVNELHANQLQWLSDFMRIVHCLCFGKPLEFDGVSTPEELLLYMKNALRMLPRHKRHVEQAIKVVGARKASHFARHWIAYTGAALSGLTVIVYFKQNPGKLTGWKNQVIGAAQNLYNNSIEGPIKRTREAVMGIESEENKELYQQAELVNFEVQNIENFTKDSGDKSDSEHAVEHGNKNNWAAWLAGQFGVGKITKGDAILGSFGRIVKGVHAVAKIGANDIGQLRRQLNLTLAIVTLVPLSAALYGTYWASKKTIKAVVPADYDYLPIKDAMFAAERVLNLYSDDDDQARIDREDLGRLVYSQCRLLHESRYIPEPYRMQFKRDIADLESPRNTMHQKRRLLNIMHRQLYEIIGVPKG